MHLGVNVINVAAIVTESVSAILDEVTRQLLRSSTQNDALKDEQRMAITCRLQNKQFIWQALAKVPSHSSKIVVRMCLLSSFAHNLA